jgi:hypothetical protein
MASPPEYVETQVSARRTCVTSLNIEERARTWATGRQEILNEECFGEC